MTPESAAPEGWVRSTIGEAARLVKDKTDPTLTNPETPYVGLEHVQAHTMRLLGRGQATDVKSTKSVFQAGDVLYGKLRPYLNKVALPDFDGICSTDFLVLGESAKLDSRYLAHYLNQLWVADQAHQLSNGVELPRVNWQALSQLPIDFPPEKAEQRAIVKQIERATDLRFSTKEHLAASRKAIQRFRHSVLMAASSGRLTETWRMEHEQAEWQFAPAKDVCAKVQSGGTPRTGFTDEPGIPFLKVYNIVDQHVDFSYRPQYVPEDVHTGVLKKSIAYPGDVIMNIVGPPLGKVAIIPDTYPEWNLNQAITIFRPGPNVLGEWLYIYLCSGTFLDDEDLVTRGSAGQSNISLTQCRNLVTPVPSRDEQREIVQRVSEFLATIDVLLARLDTADRAVERTSQAFLSKAFHGELTRSR